MLIKKCMLRTALVLLAFNFNVATADEFAPSYNSIPDREKLEAMSIAELTKHIRQEKFDKILPQVMREEKVDMWIHVMREGGAYTFNDVGAGFYRELGDTSGVFIFTDRGGNRIERAVLGRRTMSMQFAMEQMFAQMGQEDEGEYPEDEGADYPEGEEEGGFGFDFDSMPDPIKESGAYDIVVDILPRDEKPDPKTEYDMRFKGIGEFVAARDPKRIAVNYVDQWAPTVGADSNDGISHADFRLLTKEIGEKYASRIVSSERVEIKYLSRPVASEIVMLKRIRDWIAETQANIFSKIAAGTRELDQLNSEISSMNRGNTREGFENGTLQPGDFFILDNGAEAEYDLRHLGSQWRFGNFYELVVKYGYLLPEGETDVPADIRKIWDDSIKIREITADNIKIGLTGKENFKVIVEKLTEAGFHVNPVQEFRDDVDPNKTQVSIDLHAQGKGRNAPRIGSIGPAWEHNIPIPENHHFMMEFFIFRDSGNGEPNHIWFHDGAIVTKNGVEYLSEPPTEIHLIK